MTDKLEYTINAVLGCLIIIEIVVSTITLSYEDFSAKTRSILLKTNIILIVLIVLLFIISTVMYYSRTKR